MILGPSSSPLRSTGAGRTRAHDARPPTVTGVLLAVAAGDQHAVEGAAVQLLERGLVVALDQLAVDRP